MVDPAQDDAFNSASLLDGDGRAAEHDDRCGCWPSASTFQASKPSLERGSAAVRHRSIHRGRGAGRADSAETGVGVAARAGDMLRRHVEGFLRGVGQLIPIFSVNLPGDSCFGAETEQWEHLALGGFGSVELRVSMVRAVKSGFRAHRSQRPPGAENLANDPYRNPRSEDGVVVKVTMDAGAGIRCKWLGANRSPNLRRGNVILIGAAPRDQSRT